MKIAWIVFIIICWFVAVFVVANTKGTIDGQNDVCIALCQDGEKKESYFDTVKKECVCVYIVKTPLRK